MDLMLLIIVLAVVFVLVLLWVKTDELSRRQERTDKDAVALEARLERLQSKVAKLASAPTTTAVVQAREAATPEVAPVAAPLMPAAAAAPVRPAAAASGPAIPSQRSAPPPPARRGWVAREEIPERPAYGPVTWIESSPGPRGPRLVERILRHYAAARDRYAELMASPVTVDRVLDEGAARLQPIVDATLAEVREKMGLR